MDQVGAAKFVSKLDLLKGYWQVPLTPRAQEITSFITPSGLYSYSVMSFGLRNAPATFQRLMNKVVFGLEGCAVYLDDVSVFSDTCPLGKVTSSGRLFMSLQTLKRRPPRSQIERFYDVFCTSDIDPHETSMQG